jgi:hypothetical protein
MITSDDTTDATGAIGANSNAASKPARSAD